MFQIRRMGCNGTHDESFQICRPNGYDCYLALFVKSRAIFEVEGREVLTEPGTFILFDARAPHYYKAAGERYCNDWLQFNGDLSRINGITEYLNRPLLIGDAVCVDGYMGMLCNLFYCRNNELAASYLLSALLTEIVGCLEKPELRGPHYRELVRIRTEVYEHPERDWSIVGMAERMHISEPYLQEIYKKSFGISCIADVIQSRVDKAKILLADTELGIAEIGYQCGYSSAVHFSRQFRKMTGEAPLQWRNREFADGQA